MNLSRVIRSRRLGNQTFTVLRSSGSFVNGRWSENDPQQISMRGIVTVATEKELNQLPEGDMIKGGMVFHTVDELFSTRTGNDPGTSDKIVWHGEEYKLFQIGVWSDYGFYRAVGERIKGS